MKRILLVGLCLIISGHGLFAQNKTLGVGVASPNPNAALHVESPTGNQGFIMPRMTSAQRFASSFTSVLKDTDKGLMVFDTDLNTIFIWNGVSWQDTGDVAGGVKLTYPYVDSVTSGTGTNDLIAFKYNAAEPKRILRVENHSTTNGSSALSVYNAGSGLSGYFQTANPASTSSTVWATTNSDAGGDLAPVAIYGESTGIGSLGGVFRTQNPANPHAALFAESKGTGNAIMAVTSSGFSAIQGEAVGGFSNGVSGISSSPETGSFAILGANNGGGPAGVFDISNNTNTSTSLESRTIGLGRAARFSINNSNSGAQALSVESNGTGPVAFLRRTNTAANIPALYIDAQSGGGVRADNAGADGYAAIFQNVNTANATSALYAETIGTGPSIWALKSIDAIAGDAFRAENAIPSGSAALFETTNPGNGDATLKASTTGTGTAGDFQVSNQTSTSSAVRAATSSANGKAIEAANNGNGIAFGVLSGSVKIVSVEITTGSSFDLRGSAYRITGGASPFTLGFSPVDGEIFMIYNESGSNITVEGVTINDGEGKMLVVFPGGVIRGF